MKKQKYGKQFSTFLNIAVNLAKTAEADAILVLVEGQTNWEKIAEVADGQPVIIAADAKEYLEGASDFNLKTIALDMPEAAVTDRLTQALIESLADEYLKPGSSVIAVYCAYEPSKMDTVSFVRLHEHLGRLTSRDLQQIETQVPLDTLKTVVDLAVAIGREGREGKPVGTMLVVGDSRKCLAQSHEAVWDPVKGYNRKDRNLNDARNRDAVKEIAQLDGAFIISADGTVEASCRIIDTAPVDSVEFSLSKGLGSRHYAAAAISHNTKAVAIVVSESNGTVRLFQNGDIILRIEPFRRAMKWKDFEFEQPGKPEPE